jgi:hypothetical protein
MGRQFKKKTFYSITLCTDDEEACIVTLRLSCDRRRVQIEKLYRRMETKFKKKITDEDRCAVRHVMSE